VTGATSGGQRRWPLVLVVVLALVVHAPALAWGFFADDHGLLLVLEHPLEHPTLRPWSLFDFGGVPATGREHDASNLLPWWTSPDWKTRFFRPITSVTHALDFASYGREAVLHHATSFALYAVLLLLLHALYLGAGLSRSVALWALAVFAFEDGSFLPVCWLANRSTLIEAVFAVAAVLHLMRGLPSPSLGRIVVALGLALAACLSKESGVVTFAALAMQLAIAARATRDGAARRRLSTFAAVAALLGVAYVAAYVAIGYGTRSLFYLTPWSHPVEFAGRALVMIVLGAQGALGPFSVDTAMYFPALFVPWIAIALCVATPVAIAIYRAERGLPQGLFFAAWSFLAVLPQAGTMPSDRLLFIPMIGLAPWIGAFARRALTPAPWRRRWLPALVALGALPASGLSSFGRCAWFAPIIDKINRAATSAEVPRDGTRCDALIFQTGSMLSMLAPDPMWISLTGIEAVRFHPIQAARAALRITTESARAFEVESLDRPLLGTPFEEVFLSSRAPPPVGTLRHGRGFEVEIRRVDEHGLRAIRVVLDEPIASARWRFLTWRDGAFRAFSLPEIGATLELPECEPLDPLLP